MRMRQLIFMAVVTLSVPVNALERYPQHHVAPARRPSSQLFRDVHQLERFYAPPFFNANPMHMFWTPLVPHWPITMKAVVNAAEAGADASIEARKAGGKSGAAGGAGEAAAAAPGQPAPKAGGGGGKAGGGHPKACSLKSFCEDRGMFKNADAEFHMHDFCLTRGDNCNTKNKFGSGLKLCHHLAYYTDCKLNPKTSDCDGLLGLDEVTAMCGEDRNPANNPSEICSLKQFCSKAGEGEGKSHSDYCEMFDEGKEACGTPMESHTGKRLCMDYAFYGDCEIEGGDCDGTIDGPELAVMCAH